MFLVEKRVTRVRKRSHGVLSVPQDQGWTAAV